MPSVLRLGVLLDMAALLQTGSGGDDDDGSLDGESITIFPLAATLMACDDHKSAAGAAYLPALESADSWAIDGGELVLSSGGEESLRFGAT
jgi:heat shock protein HslJ